MIRSLKTVFWIIYLTINTWENPELSRVGIKTHYMHPSSAIMCRYMSFYIMHTCKTLGSHIYTAIRETVQDSYSHHLVVKTLKTPVIESYFILRLKALIQPWCRNRMNKNKMLLIYWHDKDVQFKVFIGTFILANSLCHKTGPDLVHDAQLRYSEILPSVNNVRLVIKISVLAAYSLVFTEEKKGEQDLHRYNLWSGDARALHGGRDQHVCIW